MSQTHLNWSLYPKNPISHIKQKGVNHKPATATFYIVLDAFLYFHDQQLKRGF